MPRIFRKGQFKDATISLSKRILEIVENSSQVQTEENKYTIYLSDSDKQKLMLDILASLHPEQVRNMRSDIEFVIGNKTSF